MVIWPIFIVEPGGRGGSFSTRPSVVPPKLTFMDFVLLGKLFDAERRDTKYLLAGRSHQLYFMLI